MKMMFSLYSSEDDSETEVEVSPLPAEIYNAYLLAPSDADYFPLKEGHKPHTVADM